MRKIIQTISSIFFVRYFVKLILTIKTFFERIWSNLKFKSLVKNSGDSICHYSTEIKFGKNMKKKMRKLQCLLYRMKFLKNGGY